MHDDGLPPTIALPVVRAGERGHNPHLRTSVAIVAAFAVAFMGVVAPAPALLGAAAGPMPALGLAAALVILAASYTTAPHRPPGPRMRLSSRLLAVGDAADERVVRWDGVFELQIQRVPLAGSAALVSWVLAAPGQPPMRFVHIDGEPAAASAGALR